MDGLYFGLGGQFERFSISGKSQAPSGVLQDFASILSLEYFQGGSPVASLSLKPGFYFQNEVRSDSFDSPFQAVTGVPLSGNVSGVIGISGARFYHQVIPIAGLSWNIDPKWRIDAVFPEPALVYSASKDLEAKLTAELQSGGFRTNTGDPVEYYSYQLNGHLRYSVNRALKLSGAIGYELARNFDYFSRNQEFKGNGAWVLQCGCTLSF
jgi:hypothetical protein